MIKFASNFWSSSTKYFFPKCYGMVSATFNFSIIVEKIMYIVYFGGLNLKYFKWAKSGSKQTSVFHKTSSLLSHNKSDTLLPNKKKQYS